MHTTFPRIAKRLSLPRVYQSEGSAASGTLGPERSGSAPKYKIKKIWQAEERKLTGYNAFPGLHFEMERQ
jgi:hypothetical protein